MSARTQTVSRYRMLRGKSVSEARKTANQAIDEPDDGSSTSPPARTSTFGSPTWRKRSKTQVNLDSENILSDIHHFLVPPIPTPPALLKEHIDTARPRAAVMPSPLSFTDPSSPTPLSKRQSNQALSSQFASSPKITPIEADAPDDDGKNEIKVQGDGSRMSGFEENKHQRVEDEDPVLLAQRLEAETDRILAEQKKLDLARLHQQLIATSPPTKVARPSSIRTPTKNHVFERLGFLSRSRKSHVMLSPVSSTTASIDFARAQSMEPLLTPRSILDQSPHLATPPLTPLSPLNNDRHIIVCYRGEYVSVPVKADTSTVDILRQASEMMTNPINISASIVLESWAPHGLERRLRRYERIHDVLNSWNHDAQSSLLILHSLGPTSDKDLDISSVPATEAPTPGLNLQLHHCTRPGRWHKRWITLLGDGLLIASKKTGAGPADRDSHRLCHLSTYDIYNLLSKLTSNLDNEQARSPRGTPMKNLKPPKRYVFALKSQQKPTIYTDTSNFVHFFCTEDRDVAQEFHDRIHAWRSWYMVRTRRELQTKRQLLNDEIPEPPVEPRPEEKPEPGLVQRSDPQSQAMEPLLKRGSAPQIESVPQITPVKHNPRKSVFHVRVSPGHKMRLSIDETPYTIGAFQPLVDLERFDKPIEEFGKDWIPTTERLSLLSTTPGTESGASEATALTTPSSKGPFTTRRDDLDFSSPSEERRKRRDHKRAVASSGATEDAPKTGFGGEENKDGLGISAPHTTPDGASASDNNRNSHESFLAEPETPSKPEPSPWLPSAAEHTAKVRAEQKRLERLNYPVLPPQRPVTSTGVTNHNPYQNSQQERRGARSARGTQRGQPVLPTNLVSHYKAATQWVEDMSSSKYLEVPGASHNVLRNMPSMPILIETATSGRSGLSPDTPAVPVFWRDQSLSSTQRPSTSGKDQSAASGQRPSTSRRDASNPSSRRPSTTSGRESPIPSSHSPSASGGDKSGRSPNGRTVSGTSLRRSFVGVGSPPGEELPPMPPVPPHLYQLARDGRNGEPGAALGIRAPGMLQRSSTTLR